jgi:hypothetical protein
MDTVQALRAKAAANGSLQTNTQEVVQNQGSDITIVPAAPDVVYVPYYDPGLVYGVWWWPAQPPLFWNPPLAYRPTNFGNIGSGGIAFGGRVVVNGSNFCHFRPNWGAHTILVGSPRRGGGSGNSGSSGAAAWHHDPAHRLGVAYRTVPTTNRVVQQTAPPRPQVVQTVQPQIAGRPQQAEAYRPVPQAAVQQPRAEMPASRPVPVQVEPHPAPAHGEPGHSEPAHADSNHNTDNHK